MALLVSLPRPSAVSLFPAAETHHWSFNAAELWAGYVLQLVVVLLLVAEFFATRPGRRKQSADAVLKTEGKAAPILSEKA